MELEEVTESESESDSEDHQQERPLPQGNNSTQHPASSSSDALARVTENEIDKILQVGLLGLLILGEGDKQSKT